jgi:hypothetical protein
LAEELTQDNIIWLMERQVDSYLVWIGLWLICLLGNVTVLTSLALNNIHIPLARTMPVLFLYLGLIGGMVYSVCYLGSIMRDHIRLANQIQDTALRNYILSNRRTLSRLIVSDRGEICKPNLTIVCALHLLVFLPLLYGTLL